MIISEIQLYEVLSVHLGTGKAKAITEYIESKVEKQLNDKTNLFATKENIANLKTEIANSKVDIVRWGGATGIALAGVMVAVVKFL